MFGELLQNNHFFLCYIRFWFGFWFNLFLRTYCLLDLCRLNGFNSFARSTWNLCWWVHLSGPIRIYLIFFNFFDRLLLSFDFGLEHFQKQNNQTLIDTAVEKLIGKEQR